MRDGSGAASTLLNRGVERPTGSATRGRGSPPQCGCGAAGLYTGYRSAIKLSGVFSMSFELKISRNSAMKSTLA